MNISPTQIAVLRPVIVFAHRHDSLPWFRVWFSISTVVASIVFNLGIFVALVCAHMGLDVIKYRTLHRLRWPLVIFETIRESLVDLFFITFGILLGILFHHTIAIAGLGRLGEMPMLLLTVIVRIGPRFKIAEHIMEIVTSWQHHLTQLSAPGAPLTKGEKTVCAAILVTATLILLLPAASLLSWEQVRATTQKELTPRFEMNLLRTLHELP